ncbi:MAG: ABC transporter substrate-binding protein, partial [Acetobacteraceae bacterium]|nr:ABC transporter substrate-binding protein [Acetobacteraceae bacterium]
MLHRRTLLSGAALGAAGLAAPRILHAADTTGVTATEIRIGNTCAYSGPASAYGVIGRSEAAFFRMVNDQGGIAGRKINFITYDDGYSPPKTVEQARRLIEQDQVALLFQTLGTPCNSAIV